LKPFATEEHLLLFFVNRDDVVFFFTSTFSSLKIMYQSSCETHLCQAVEGGGNLGAKEARCAQLDSYEAETVGAEGQGTTYTL
jgi:hypothetical protein